MITHKKITQQSQQGRLVILLSKIPPASLSSSQSGFTILECLMAVVVVSILLSAIAPVIALSVATRVQARRVEQATQAARAYIDGVRAGAIDPPTQIASLSTADGKKWNKFNGDVDAPTSSGSLSCTTNTYCANTSSSSLYCIDLDIPNNGCSSSSANDLIIQAFRTSNAQNYLLGLRVYRANGFSDNGAFKKSNATDSSNPTKVTAATYTKGLGDRKAPLVEITTDILTATPKKDDFCLRLNPCQ